jgi:hypothetical protein
MGGITSIDAVYVALVFIVPGYIFLSLRNQFVAGQDRLGTEQILAFVTYSALNFALFGWTVYLAVAYELPPFLRAASWVLTLVIIPAGLGLLCGICSQKEIVDRIYKFFGLNPIHPTPRAWERVFFNSAPSWVFITLKSGTEYAGFWGGQSFASSDAKERDLYISEIFDFSGDEPWKPTGKGLFIAPGEIRTIEFIPVRREPQHDEHAQGSEFRSQD